MILQALYELAEFDGLMEDPDFQAVPVAWWVSLDASGKCLGILDRRYMPEQVGKKKPKLVAPPLKAPTRSGRTSGVQAQFMVDNPQYVFGIAPPDKPGKPERMQQCLEAFTAQVAECAQATQDEGAQAVLAFLQDIASGRQTLEWNEEWSPADLFAFSLSKEPDTPVHLRPAVQAYWRKRRELPVSEEAAAGRCLVTAQPVSGSELFPLLRKVPGGTPSGVALVSCNARAFESYGWKGNENALISREAGEACARALNRLLDPKYPNPRDPGRSLPERRYRLTNDTVVGYWAPSQEVQDFLNFLPSLLDCDPSQVGELYHSIWRGRAPQMKNPAAFYAIVLTGTQGRAIMREWFETTVANALRNVSQYFDDTDLVRNTPKPKNRDHPPAQPLQVILRALAVRGDTSRLPNNLASELFQAAILGRPFPRHVLLRAIERARAESGEKEWLDLERRDARAALLKAFLNRQLRDPNNRKNYPEVTPTMDDNNNDPGYVLGRLMAVLEKLQKDALGDVNATVVDRYFKRASTTPLFIFKNLLRVGKSHQRKLEHGDEKDKRKAKWLSNQVDDLMARITAEDNIPRNLDLEGQALFLLGYHHQRHALWQKREKPEVAAVGE